MLRPCTGRPAGTVAGAALCSLSSLKNFDNLHNLGDPEEVVRQSAMREVNFLSPDEMAFDPLSLKG